MAQVERLDLLHAQLLVVDMQERLLPHIRGYSQVIAAAERMIRAARAFDIAVTVCEQYPNALGPTDATIKAAVEADAEPVTPLEKMTFSLCGDDAGRQHVSGLMRPQVIIVGVETHVCVQQTALDLLAMQMRPFVLADAVGSRREYDHQVALERMRQAGVIVTTVEAAIFELAKEAGTEQFKRVFPLIKAPR